MQKSRESGEVPASRSAHLATRHAGASELKRREANDSRPMSADVKLRRKSHAANSCLPLRATACLIRLHVLSLVGARTDAAGHPGTGIHRQLHLVDSFAARSRTVVAVDPGDAAPVASEHSLQTASKLCGDSHHPSPRRSRRWCRRPATSACSPDILVPQTKRSRQSDPVA